MSGDKNEVTKKRKNDKWSNFCIRECRSLSEEELSVRLASNSNRDSLRFEPGGGIWQNGASQGVLGVVSEKGTSQSTHSNYNGFWVTFATEEEKSKWWAEATFEFRTWREAQPEIRGVYDGSTAGLHEKFRRARIKQLGNGIVRTIAQLHGERIKYHEFSAEAAL